MKKRTAQSSFFLWTKIFRLRVPVNKQYFGSFNKLMMIPARRSIQVYSLVMRTYFFSYRKKIFPKFRLIKSKNAPLPKIGQKCNLPIWFDVRLESRVEYLYINISVILSRRRSIRTGSSKNHLYKHKQEKRPITKNIGQYLHQAARPSQLPCLFVVFLGSAQTQSLMAFMSNASLEESTLLSLNIASSMVVFIEQCLKIRL